MAYQELLFPGGSFDRVLPMYEDAVVASFYSDWLTRLLLFCWANVFSTRYSMQRRSPRRAKGPTSAILYPPFVTLFPSSYPIRTG